MEDEAEPSLQYILKTQHILMYDLELTKWVFWFAEDIYLSTKYSAK